MMHLPEISGVFVHTSIEVGYIQLLEQILVPLAVDVPMLHGVTNITCLDDMLNLQSK